MKALTRRELLARAAAVSGLAGTMLGGLGLPGCGLPTAAAIPPQPRGAFSLGVASGDPEPDGVVLWTRLARDPLNGGGMAPVPEPVEWRVAEDPEMARVVQSGTVMARPEEAHAVHVEVRGLKPARWYWYRFFHAGEPSRLGRTRTAPAPGGAAETVRFAVASCQRWESGYYTAYRHMAGEDLHLVLFLGDYIYEGAIASGRARYHASGPVTSLADYRDRYALYKLDPHLQAAHAAFPWVVTWDDHEVINNYANAEHPRFPDRAAFLQRRAAAYQAYYEHMPLRAAQRPAGPNLRLYRRLDFGDLLALHVLDTRQYRTGQPCGDGLKPLCAAALAPGATMLGAAQETWLRNGLATSPARWNALAQQVPLMQRAFPRRKGLRYAMDKWDGYRAARERLFAAVAEGPPGGVIVLSGDVHSGWVGDLWRDFDRPGSPILGSEFVATSISSGGDGSEVTSRTAANLAANPHIKFYNRRRGYLRCEVSPTQWRSDFRVVPYVETPNTPIMTRASFLVSRGRPGVVRL